MPLRAQVREDRSPFPQAIAAADAAKAAGLAAGLNTAGAEAAGRGFKPEMERGRVVDMQKCLPAGCGVLGPTGFTWEQAFPPRALLPLLLGRARTSRQ